jgi:hypothetical protein
MSTLAEKMNNIPEEFPVKASANHLNEIDD